MNAKIEISTDAIAAFCQRNHIRRMAFFGSVLRDDFGPAREAIQLMPRRRIRTGPRACPHAYPHACPRIHEGT